MAKRKRDEPADILIFSLLMIAVLEETVITLAALLPDDQASHLNRALEDLGDDPKLPRGQRGLMEQAVDEMLSRIALRRDEVELG